MILAEELPTLAYISRADNLYDFCMNTKSLVRIANKNRNRASPDAFALNTTNFDFSLEFKRTTKGPIVNLELTLANNMDHPKYSLLVHTAFTDFASKDGLNISAAKELVVGPAHFYLNMSSNDRGRKFDYWPAKSLPDSQMDQIYSLLRIAPQEVEKMRQNKTKFSDKQPLKIDDALQCYVLLNSFSPYDLSVFSKSKNKSVSVRESNQQTRRRDGQMVNTSQLEISLTKKAGLVETDLQPVERFLQLYFDGKFFEQKWFIDLR